MAICSGGSGGTTALTKIGNGTITLSGNNTYTGTDFSSSSDASVLDIASASTSGATAAFAMRVSGTVIATDNTITLGSSGNSTAGLILNGGTISGGTLTTPGSSPGIQDYTVAQSWGSFSYDWEVNDWTASVAGTNIDQIAITGNLTLTGAASPAAAFRNQSPLRRSPRSLRP